MISYIVDCAGEVRTSARELQGEVKSTRHDALVVRGYLRTHSQISWVGKRRPLKSDVGETSAKG
jgi:hypothetical protein